MNAHVKVPPAIAPAARPSEIPTVRVRRSRKPGCGHIIVFAEPCPYCGKRHTHGTGGEAGVGLPGPNHGHRVSHCADPLPSQRWKFGTVAEFRERCSRGYYLLEVSEP